MLFRCSIRGQKTSNSLKNRELWFDITSVRGANATSNEVAFLFNTISSDLVAFKV